MSSNPHDLYTVFSITDDKKAVPVANYFYNDKTIATERGDIYSGELLTTIASGATYTLHIKTSSTKDTYLMDFSIATDSERVSEMVYENPTITDGSTTLTMINTNRQTSNTFTGTIYTDSTVTSVGTLIDENEVYEAKKSLGGLGANNGFRMLLERDEDYIIQVVNGNNTVRNFFIKFHLYER